MRWKQKEKPTLHETRIIKKFLFFPKCINKEWRWLEKCMYMQKYIKLTSNPFICDWVDTLWINNANILVDSRNNNKKPITVSLNNK